VCVCVCVCVCVFASQRRKLGVHGPCPGCNADPPLTACLGSNLGTYTTHVANSTACCPWQIDASITSKAPKSQPHNVALGHGCTRLLWAMLPRRVRLANATPVAIDITLTISVSPCFYSLCLRKLCILAHLHTACFHCASALGYIMPSISSAFWAIFALIFAAFIYQAGVLLPSFIPAPIHNLLATTHCYTSVTTLSPHLPRADCFSVLNGKISRVFHDESSAVAIKESRTGYVLPGLWDGHGHLIQYGELLNSANLFGAKSMDEVKERLVEYKATHAGVGSREQWLRGVGWDQANFDGQWPISVGPTPIGHGTYSGFQN
jgi:hypothetical protein